MRDFQDVLHLHTLFEFPCSEFTECPTQSIFEFRRRFLHEELDEYNVGFSKNNFVGVVDALIDFVYVCIGTALFVGTARHGLQSIWPTFATARQALINQEVIDDDQCVPHPLEEPLHMFTTNSMRSRVVSFENAYFAACQENAGASTLMVVQLKQAVDEAYKSAAMMCVPWDRCWRHVAEANLKKKPGPVAKRANKIPWDLSKPMGWVAPDAKIATELMLEGWSMPENMRIDNVSGKVEVIKDENR
jgi:predicted HAD superfamily Cof-like phosphohydrolase